MSARRSRSRQSTASRISDDQINDLVSKLQQLLPEIRTRRSDKVFIKTRAIVVILTKFHLIYLAVSILVFPCHLSRHLLNIFSPFW